MAYSVDGTKINTNIVCTLIRYFNRFHKHAKHTEYIYPNEICVQCSNVGSLAEIYVIIKNGLTG